MKFANKKNLPRARTRQNSRDVINTAAGSVNYRILKEMLRLPSDDAEWTQPNPRSCPVAKDLSRRFRSFPLPFHFIDLYV